MVSTLVGPHSPLGPTQQPNVFGLLHSGHSLTSMQKIKGSILDYQYKGSGKTDAETHLKTLTVVLEGRGFTVLRADTTEEGEGSRLCMLYEQN